MSDLEKILAPLTGAPIAEWLGYSVEPDVQGLVHRLAFAERHIGNPGIRAIHGGVVATFLEFAAQAELAVYRGEARYFPTATNSVDYMQPTQAIDLFARVRIDRLARRVAFLQAVAWQESEAKPVAAARVCLRLAADREPDENEAREK